MNFHAKSFVCGDCGAQLRSLKEAQNHGEVTGHTNFSESTEAVVTMMCSTCSKPCRTLAEQEMHTRFTGHAEFVDKTAEQKDVDTEAEMKKLKEEMTDEGEEESEAQGMDVDEDMVPVEVDQDLLKQLEDMGFPTNRATRAIHMSGCTSVEGAVNWVVEHENDADLDDPVFVAKSKLVTPKIKLSPEEAKAQAADLVRKAKLKKEKEEREMEKLREQERIRSGKELLIAKRKEEECERKRLLEFRKKEKENDAKAKARIKEKLEEDRIMRRKKMGLPEEYTEEELAQIAEKQKKKEEAEEAKRRVRENAGVPKVKPVTVVQQLRAELVKLKTSLPGEDEKSKKAFNTLLTYLGNIAKNPSEEKFRKIKLTNAAFQARVGSHPGGIEFLELCGFEKDSAGESMIMAPEKVNMELLNGAGAELNSALTNPFFGVL